MTHTDTAAANAYANANSWLRGALWTALTELSERHPKSAPAAEQALTVLRNTATTRGMLAMEDTFYLNYDLTNSKHDRRVWRTIARVTAAF